MMRSILIATLGSLLLAALVAGPSSACTAFSMDTPNGPLYGTNCDLAIPGNGVVIVNPRGVAKEGFRENTAGESARWVSRYGSLTFSLVGREFAWGGMNEAGLAISTLQSNDLKYPNPDERVPFDVGAMVQYLLDNCGSVAEIVETMPKVSLVTDGKYRDHLFVVDQEGACAAIEYLDGELVIYTGETLPLKALANIKYERAVQAYERGGPRWWWSNPGRSCQRVATAVDRAKAFDPDGETNAITYAFTTLVRDVADRYTKWNIVFDIEKRQVWYRSVRSPGVKVIAFEDLDFECGGPMMMQDINAAAEGDMSGAFAPYDREVNLELFLSFLNLWGIKVDPEESAELMTFFEGFECAITN